MSTDNVAGKFVRSCGSNEKNPPLNLKILQIDNLNAFSDGQLSDFCDLFELSSVGDRAALIKRLKKYKEEKYENETEDLEDGNDDNENDNNHDTIQGDTDATTTIVASLIKELRREKQPEFSFRDAEDALPKFSDTDGQNIRCWLNDFNELAKQFKWKHQQKHIYAKRLVTGTAKLFLQKEAKPRTFFEFENALIEEYGQCVSAAVATKIMSETKKKTNETNQEYLYRMMDIGMKANLDCESIIIYTVDGLPGDAKEKMNLYEATTYGELKRKMEKYDLVSKKSKKIAALSKNEGATIVVIVNTRRTNVLTVTRGQSASNVISSVIKVPRVKVARKKMITKVLKQLKVRSTGE